MVPRSLGGFFANRSSGGGSLTSRATAGPAAAPSTSAAAVTIAAARRSRPPISNFRLDFSALQFMTIPKPTARGPVIWGESAEVHHDQEERSNAWFDARLAAAVPPDYRARRQVPRNAGSRHPLGRRPHR